MVLPTLLLAASIFDPILLQHSLVQPPHTIVSEHGVGELLITVDGDTVGAVPKGATRVRLATLRVSASCAAPVSITSIRLTHRGMGSVSDVRSIYASHALTRLTRPTSFDRSSGHAMLQFRNLTVPACDAVDIDVLMDVQPTAVVTGEHGIAVLRADDVRSTAKRTTVQSTDSTLKTIAARDQGTVSVRFLPLSGSLRYGRVETVARIQLSADATSDHLIRRITLTNEEDARDLDLIHFVLTTRSGESLSGPAVRMVGRTVRIDLKSPLLLQRSSTVVLLLSAEVRTSRYRKVQFVLEEPSDLVSVPVRLR